MAPAENHCAFDEILKFTDITWPGMGDKILPYFGGNFVDLLAHSLREYLDEVLHKEWDVLKTVSQGRHGDRKYVDDGPALRMPQPCDPAGAVEVIWLSKSN